MYEVQYSYLCTRKTLVSCYLTSTVSRMDKKKRRKEPRVSYVVSHMYRVVYPIAGCIRAHPWLQCRAPRKVNLPAGRTTLLHSPAQCERSTTVLYTRTKLSVPADQFKNSNTRLKQPPETWSAACSNWNFELGNTSSHSTK